MLQNSVTQRVESAYLSLCQDKAMTIMFAKHRVHKIELNCEQKEILLISFGNQSIILLFNLININQLINNIIVTELTILILIILILLLLLLTIIINYININIRKKIFRNYVCQQQSA